LPGCPNINRSAVGQAGERVGEGHLLQLMVLGLQLMVEISDAAARSYARLQFAGMERLGQIVVGS